MPISIVLQDENGEVLERVSDTQGFLFRLLPDVGDEGYCFLSCIDRYGDTVFNRLQIPRLLAEWELIGVKVRQMEEQSLCRSVRLLFENALSEPHLYVRFVGD